MNNIDWSEIFEYRDGKLLNAYTRNGRAKEGDEAGCVDSNGYWKVRHNFVQYYIHRIIYEMFNGDIDESKVIVHKDGDRGNNNIDNLELVAYVEVDTISGRMAKNRSLPVGVVRAKYGRFIAQIVRYGKYHYLGTFDTVREAYIARSTAQKVLASGKEVK